MQASSFGSTFIYELAVLLIAALILIDAGIRLLRATRTLPRLAWIPPAAWFVITLFVVSLWPFSPYPLDYPRHSFVFFAAVAVYVHLLSQSVTGRFKNVIPILRKIAIIAICLLLLESSFRYLIYLRPQISASDFFYYVCTARDMSAALPDQSMMRYFYFPGVYTFWRVIFYFVGDTLNDLQWSYLALLAANALLIFGIIFRVLKNGIAAVIALVWYIVFCSRFWV
jgi:hypothetical protein